MELWSNWYWCICRLRPAFSRKRSFLWAMVTLAGLCIRTDLLGVTSIVRVLGLSENAYRSILKFFHSKGVKLDKLITCWVSLAMRLFSPVTIGDYIILELDGIKVAKEGRKMPAVKCLHQESNNNSKAEYIMGHSIQCIALLVKGFGGAMAAVPLIAAIHEGLVWSNRDARTLIDKAVTVVEQVLRAINKKCMIVADAYYCNAKFLLAMKRIGHHVISRVRNNAVGYTPAEKTGKRGRPKKYGKKVILASLFENLDLFTTIPSPVYGETNVQVRYYAINLFWKPLKQLIRFVLVIHPTRGRAIFASSDTMLDPVIVITTYGYRYKIELSFKHALRIIGTYGYHFWMKAMDPIKRFSGDQYLHRKSQDYRDAIKQKMNAYATYLMMGCIAQGILLHLCMNHAQLVWGKFGGWLRTMNTDSAPSELVAANALRTRLPEFLAGSRDEHAFKKFLFDHIDPRRAEILRLTG